VGLIQCKFKSALQFKNSFGFQNAIVLHQRCILLTLAALVLVVQVADCSRWSVLRPQKFAAPL